MDDLVTSCWFCTFGKGSATIEFLGLRDPREREPVRDGWDGLRRVRWSQTDQAAANTHAVRSYPWQATPTPLPSLSGNKRSD
jgi:hypothetical protein